MTRKSQRTVYRSCEPVVDVRYDADDGRRVPEALVGAIADAEGVSPTEVPPLYDAVDLEALSRMFERADVERDSNRLFSFTFERWNVFGRGDGRIRVCDGTRHTDPEPVFDGVA